MYINITWALLEWHEDKDALALSSVLTMGSLDLIIYLLSGSFEVIV